MSDYPVGEGSGGSGGSGGREVAPALPGYMSALQVEQAIVPPRGMFLTGNAGTGKTYYIREVLAKNPGKYKLCATTGIAAANIGEEVTTLHTALKFAGGDSLEEMFIKGVIQRQFRLMQRDGYEGLIIDEASMLGALTLDRLVSAASSVSDGSGANAQPFWIILVGDMCQLPPIADKDRNDRPIPKTGDYIFEADCWNDLFAPRVQRLTKVWRQTHPEFLNALNFARSGQGFPAANSLVAAGVEFTRAIDPDFPGTTIVATNAEVTRFNTDRLLKLPGQTITLSPHMWGTPEVQSRPPADWKVFKDPLQLKRGALVMVLVNDTVDWDYVNGDLGYVRDYHAEQETLEVELLRPAAADRRVVQIPWARRRCMWKDVPEVNGFDAKSAPKLTQEQVKNGEEPLEIYYNSTLHRWCHGMLGYVPVRLAYASTCHKVQGLSLTNVQVDPSAGFFGKPAMAYVALSRARTPEGLKIVGSPELIAARVKVDPKVVPWL